MSDRSRKVRSKIRRDSAGLLSGRRVRKQGGQMPPSEGVGTNRERKSPRPRRRTLEDEAASQPQPKPAILDREKPVTAKQKACVLNFAKRSFEIGVKGIWDEYTSINTYVPPKLTQNAFNANMEKNRYKDVCCADGSRVILKNQENDYIHANYVKGEPLLNTFICTQGPISETIRDFWMMIAQENVGNIFMLCETSEQGKEKCQQYWPRDVGDVVEWPGIRVRNMHVDKSDSTTIMCVLEVTIGKQLPMAVRHHQWRSWPDKSVPSSIMAPFRLLRTARNSDRPTIVHCSAGIGRTGTVVGLEMALQQMLSEKELILSDVIKTLRNQRPQSVQTNLQYVYMHKCLLAFASAARLFTDEETIKKMQAFDKDYAELVKKQTETVNKEAYTPLTPARGFAASKSPGGNMPQSPVAN